MKVLISGSTGLIGSALSRALSEQGHTPVPLLRARPGAPDGCVMWDPAAGVIDEAALEGVDAVVHLAGESVAGRWTRAKKGAIRESRVLGTRLLAQAVCAAAAPPRAFVSASAIGCYGERGDAWLDEDSAPGDGFLAEVCQEWEAESLRAADAGARVVNLRFGMALSGSGGALAAMLPVFRLGLGGPIGDGRQYVSWIALEDAVRAILFALTNDALEGPVNVVAPNPVANRDFTRTLARTLRRPALFPLPAFAARAVLGEMADALLLASARVRPARLVEAGFVFERPELEDALCAALGRRRRRND